MKKLLPFLGFILLISGSFSLAANLRGVEKNDAGSTSPQRKDNQIPAELVGAWAVTSSREGYAFQYVFNADGAYEYIGEMEKLNIVQAETGTVSVQSERLTLKRKRGTIREGNNERSLEPETRSYHWQIKTDPYVGDRVLWLTDAKGQKSRFYGGRTTPKPPSLPLKIEVSPLKFHEHPSLGHQVFLDMNKLTVHSPRPAAEMLEYDVRRLPDGEWVVLRNGQGKTLPIRVFRDGYESNGFSPRGRLLIEWLPQ